MDYGKLAYIKAEELEQRIAGREKTVTRSQKAVFRPRVRLTERGYPLAKIAGDGTVTAVVRAQVRAGGPYRGTLRLSAGSLGISDARVQLGAGEETSCVLLAALDCRGGAEVSVSADEGLILVALELAVTGSGAKVFAKAGDCTADGRCVLTAEDERVRARPAQNPMGEGKVVGFGRRADLIAAGGGYLVVYSDNEDNLFGCLLDGELNVTKARYLGRGAEGVTVADDGGRAAIALLRGGKVTMRYAELDLKGVSEETDTGIAGAERIRFVKHSAVPMLTTESGGVCVLRTAEREPRGREDVFLRVSCAVEGIAK